MLSWAANSKAICDLQNNVTSPDTTKKNTKITQHNQQKPQQIVADWTVDHWIHLNSPWILPTANPCGQEKTATTSPPNFKSTKMPSPGTH